MAGNHLSPSPTPQDGTFICLISEEKNDSILHKVLTTSAFTSDTFRNGEFAKFSIYKITFL